MVTDIVAPYVMYVLSLMLRCSEYTAAAYGPHLWAKFKPNLKIQTSDPKFKHAPLGPQRQQQTEQLRK